MSSNHDKDAIGYGFFASRVLARMFENLRASDESGYQKLRLAVDGGAPLTLKTTFSRDDIGDTVLTVELGDDAIELGRIEHFRGVAQ